MSKKLTLLWITLIIAGCNQKSDIAKDLDCKPITYNNLEKIEDFKQSFKVALPKHWKTNLYYDKNQSSIYSADTTKQLTETILIDVTKVSKPLKLNSSFVKKYKTEKTNQDLITDVSKETEFLNKKTWFFKTSGKKANLPYRVYNFFVVLDSENYIQAKAEVYGDSLAEQRLCNAISLIEKTTF